jgi:hypothetical protein
MKNNYRVRWSIDLAASSPEEAARQAWKIMRTEEVEQTGYFRVYSGGHEISLDGCTEVDLADNHIETEPGELICLD